MELGFVGLGRMGANMVRRLARGGHRAHVFSIDPAEVARVAEETGSTGAASLAGLVAALAAPRTIWIMVPAGKATQAVIDELAPLLAKGDTIIDGGNSNYRDSVARAAQLARQGINFLDCGTSGGLFGLERGYSLMIGGSAAGVAQAQPLFETLAPGIEAAPRTPVKADGPIQPGEAGWLHCGKAGAGHYVKMVHNGIEYGLMQAYAEGFDILKGRSSEKLPEELRFNINLPDVAEVWRRGSVISSWLLDLCALELAEDHELQRFSGRVADSGEGQWTVDAAMEVAVPANVLTAALFARYRSRTADSFADKLLSAMRFGFGGHVEMPQ